MQRLVAGLASLPASALDVFGALLNDRDLRKQFEQLSVTSDLFDVTDGQCVDCTNHGTMFGGVGVTMALGLAARLTLIVMLNRPVTQWTESSLRHVESIGSAVVRIAPPTMSFTLLMNDL